MKRIGLLLLLMAAPMAMGQVSTWKTEPAHSKVEFSIKNLAVSTVHGNFGPVAATIDYDAADITKSRVTATIDIAKVDTGSEGRDKHLRTADFFEVEKFPTATFTSAAFARNGNQLTVTGNLTLHGVTRQVALKVDGPTAPVTGVDKRLHSTWKATTTINRKDFGVGMNYSNTTIGETVKIAIELDTVKQ